jgi:hypothetical protein
MNHGHVSSSPPHENNEGDPGQPCQGFGPAFLITGQSSAGWYLGSVALGGRPARQHRLLCTPGRPSRHGTQPVRQHLEAARQQPAPIRHPEHPTDKACVKLPCLKTGTADMTVNSGIFLRTPFPPGELNDETFYNRLIEIQIDDRGYDFPNRRCPLHRNRRGLHFCSG